MSTIIQNYVVNWYNTYLLHPVTERTKSTITQHYYWTNLRDGMSTHIKSCTTFQKNNKTLKYCKLHAKEADAIQWDRSLVYLIGPYKSRREGNDETLILKA